MKKLRLIFVGGFLGAGKTTLLWKLAEYISKKGLKTSLITNDQAPALVDSMLLTSKGLNVQEVSGSCFCCNFNGLTDAIKNAGEDCDVIIAEPVGSCVDLYATIIHPLRQRYGDNISVAPLSVLADPVRLKPIVEKSNADLSASTAYIYNKQLEESDIILVNKIDTLLPAKTEALVAQTAQKYTNAKVLPFSALTCEGLENWAETVLTTDAEIRRSIHVNYVTYAKGEADLGWLNGIVKITGKNADWDELIGKILDRLGKTFIQNKCTIAHLKMLGINGDKVVTGSITGENTRTALNGSAGKGDELMLTINARIDASPSKLADMALDVLDKILSDKYSNKVKEWNYFQPGAPQPTYRVSVKKTKTNTYVVSD
ncbi:MAG: cobalamin synthesis protein P47K [Prevotellaceae bacterium]|jgi:Ni2+-binding GTPase involved in maturation of urease and hydrogenase|nr:cobalamin synthesis protein P47K [Prevotellaceae bacterium]